MNKSLRRIVVGLMTAMFILGISFIHSSDNQLGKVEAASFEWGTVNSSTPLNIRAAGNAKAKILASYKKGKRVKCLTLGTTWVKVTVGGHTGYANGKYLTTAYGTATSPYANVRSGTANTNFKVYKTASTGGTVLTTVKTSSKLQVLTKTATWVKVKSNGILGYALGKNINLTNGLTAAGTKIPTTTSTKGEQVIAYAKQFLGNRYVYGGTSLTNGTDCSGFTMRVYEHFGYSIPRTSTTQRSAGKAVSSLSAAKAGDIICYSGHVALYMGNNQIIHASNAKDGIKISYNAAYRPILTIRRIIN